MDPAEHERFYRYFQSLLHPGTPRRSVYPDLSSQAWHDPAGFGVVDYLEAAYAEIKTEAAALDPAQFSPEREKIARTGAWDVVFFHELGMRRDPECRRCPGVAHAIDNFPVIKTPDGSVYLSRLRAGSRVAPHRGPTNVRVRCHLGLDVPAGDCAIRVDGETRHWEEGRCLVFDDSFEHEVWNNTDQDRTVLIVDLWNPALSDGEVAELEALGAYLLTNVRSLLGYWTRNAGPGRR